MEGGNIYQVKKTKIKCGILGADCQRSVQYICCHCGIPICQGRNCCRVIEEPNYHSVGASADMAHCVNCYESFHSQKKK